ncbi:MAG: nicotinamidase [Thermodesulfobacteriota bacterium]|nr:nicotinamidase [Thermodesulfobacteriota bacterium]
MRMLGLPIPEFFKYDHIQTAAKEWDYTPNVSDLHSHADQWRRKHDIIPASDQKTDIHLLGIDLQRDFCLPEGTLFVAGRSGSGAVEDSMRTAEFIYRNLDVITDITLTLDTHYLFQIFFAPFWVTEEGSPLSEHTMIVVSDDEEHLNNTDPSGNMVHENVRPNPAIAKWLCNDDYAWLQKQALFYCKKLAESGKYTLYLWPPHCLMGTVGHAVTGVISEAVMFHNLVRGAKPRMYLKGENFLTESYDPAASEVLERWDGKGNIAQARDSGFYDDVCTADVYIVLGQAASHCVLTMIDGLLTEIKDKNPDLTKKIYILIDCMSSVTVSDPDGTIVVDFTPDAEAAFERFSHAGINLVESTVPIEKWPGVQIK